MMLKTFLKAIKMLCIIYSDKILQLMKLNNPLNEPVIFISEKNDWAIKYVGTNITNSINEDHLSFIKLTTSLKYYEKKVIHFGSQYMWVDWYKFLPRSNNYVVSFFHGKKEDGEDIKKHIINFLESVPFISVIIVSSTILKKRLLSWGVPVNKIFLIPIGVNNSHFVPTNNNEKYFLRKKYGIKKKSIVIGSFQKDGIGWKDGVSPKLIKGPDIFIEVIKLLKLKGYDITVFLTGPARGYMKNELSKNKINFIHQYFKHQNELLNCYHALDFYLITSREEGGPMGLMEAMASGVPVISTPVGMAVDLIENNVSGKISIDCDSKNLIELIIDLIENCQLKNEIINNALSVVDSVNWSKVSQSHYKKIYEPLVNK